MFSPRASSAKIAYVRMPLLTFSLSFFRSTYPRRIYPPPRPLRGRRRNMKGIANHKQTPPVPYLNTKCAFDSSVRLSSNIIRRKIGNVKRPVVISFRVRYVGIFLRFLFSRIYSRPR